IVTAPGDLSTVDGCGCTVDAALTGLGGLDVLVNNAGRWNLATVEAVDEASWNETIDVNLKGAFFVTKFALAALKDERSSYQIEFMPDDAAGAKTVLSEQAVVLR